MKNIFWSRVRCGIWYAAVGFWVVQMSRVSRLLNLNSGPLEIWICAKTAWMLLA